MGRQKKNKPKKDRAARDRRRASASVKDAGPKVQPVDIAKINSIVDQTANSLSAADHGSLRAAMGTLAFLTAEIEALNTTMRRLRAILFGSATEKTESVLGKTGKRGESDEQDSQGTSNESAESGESNKDTTAATGSGEVDKTKPKGHGRQGSAALTGGHPGVRAA